MSTPPRWERWVALALVVGLGVYYFATASAEVQGADGGEFATLFAQGGVAHPPGYPLYVLYLRAMHWMPGSPALASARATALLGLPATALVYAALRAWGASAASAVLAVALFGLGRVACEQFTQAEAFALNVVLCAAFLAASGPGFPWRGRTRVVALAAIAGLGLAHHHTLATLGPLGFVAVVGAFRDEGARPRDAAWAVLAFVLGPLAYLYPWWLARHPHGEWIWGAPVSARAMLALVLRVDYWRTVAAPRYPVEYAASLGEGLFEALLGVGLFVVVVGLAVLVLRQRRYAQALALVVSFALAGPVILAQFPEYPSGVRLAIAERFFLLPTLVALVPLALGLDFLSSRVRRRWLAIAPLVVAVVVVQVLRTRARLAEDRRPTAARWVRNALRATPPGAVVLGTGDLGCFGFLYVQQATGARRDVTYVDLGMLALPWYRARIEAGLGPTPALTSDVASLVDDLLARGRTVLVALPGVELPARLRVVGHAGLLRVLAPGEPMPDAASLEADNVAWMKDFEWDRWPVRDRWSWAGFAERGYEATWRSIAERYRAEGRPADAARATACASRGALGP